MNYINNKLERIHKEDINFDIENHYKNMISFIECLGINKELVLQIYYDSLGFIIQFTDGAEYKTKYNGVVNSHKFPSHAGAFATLIEQQQCEDGFKVIPGICLRNKDVNRNLHVFTHESFHVFSDKTELPYNEKGINYSKSGLKVIYYNRKDEMINSKYNATGLNEGITELLTRKFLNEKGNNQYLFQVIITQIISSNDSSIFEAYFSRNDGEVINFFEKFENIQDIMSGDELVNMSPNIILDKDIIYHYLNAAITYNLNLVSEEKFEEEIFKIKNIVSELDKDRDYRLDSGSYIDMVNDIISKRHNILK